MDEIIIPDTLIAQLRTAVGPLKIVDRDGHIVGQFVPQSASDCPRSLEELRRIVKEESGRSLAEIWKSLGVK
jgi:hypothetical protein